MAIKDAYNEIKAVTSLNPAAKTASATGTAVATTGYSSVIILVHAGAWTDGQHTVSLEVSDDNSTYIAAAAGDLLGTFPTISGAVANACYKVGYVGTSKYVRPKTVVANTSSGAVYGISVLLANPIYGPAA